MTPSKSPSKRPAKAQPTDELNDAELETLRKFWSEGSDHELTVAEAVELENALNGD